MIQIASLHLYLFISGRGFVVRINNASWIERERKSYLAGLLSLFVASFSATWLVSLFWTFTQLGF